VCMHMCACVCVCGGAVMCQEVKRLQFIQQALRKFYVSYCVSKGNDEPFQVAARSKAWVCGRSVAGIAVSNPPGGMDFCLL